MSKQQFFSHLTAAAVHGLPLPARLQHSTTLHVSVPLPARAPRMVGVVGHHLASRTTLVNGLRVSRPVDTWRELATILTLDELIAVGDALVCRQAPYASMTELDEAVKAHGAHRGAVRLREARGWVRSGADSPKETEIRLILMRARLPEPLVNPAITDRFGGFIGFGDLAYPDFKVLVEYDGAQHFDNPSVFHRDVDRLDAFMAEHWRVVRLNRSHLARPAAIVARVREALIGGGWAPQR